ncbi:MAG: class III signal peptide-containing protein [Bdellovibrionales bacterium]|nr:class III signal peptide-containing protein [Bdellovibrionales bacterium]
MKVNLSGQSNNRGQILVEYILLMVVVVSVALIITSFMVSRNSDQPGFVISKWYQIIELIGNDLADDIKPAE